MRPGDRLVQGLEIPDWAGGLEVGGQGFLGEEETREGPVASGGPGVLGIWGQGCLEDGDQAWGWRDLEQDGKGPGPGKGGNRLPARGCPQEQEGRRAGNERRGAPGGPGTQIRPEGPEPEAGLGQAFLRDGQGWASGSGALQIREGANDRGGAA